MKELGRSARKLAVGSMAVAVLASPVLPAAGDEQTVTLGCIVRSLVLDTLDEETVLHIQTEGDPSSLGARLESDGGVVLDLAGCAPAPELTDRSFAGGLVSALELVHHSDAPGLDTAVVVRTREAFEYSVSSSPGVVQVILRSGSPDGAPEAKPETELVRVLEPLPIAVEPEAPLPEPSPPESSPPESSPPEPSSSEPAVEPQVPQPELIVPTLPPTLPPASQPEPIAPTPPASDTSAITGAVSDWAQAWSDQRVDDYLSAYASGFRPPNPLSREAWETQRRLRLVAPRFIEVTLEAMEIGVTEPGRAVVSFLQTYVSDGFTDQVYKSLTLTFEDGHWRILLEEAGAPSPQAEISTDPVAPTPGALVEGARLSVRDTLEYDSSYRILSYPGGDLGRDRGSAVDVLIRAYRHLGIDLQERVHEDILAAVPDYGIETPDTHIDHRRIRNLETFFERHGERLPLGPNADWQSGDLVFWAMDGRRQPDHVGIVSDLRSSANRPMVIHHPEGTTPREQDVLFAWTVRGHYRWLPAEAKPE